LRASTWLPLAITGLNRCFLAAERLRYEADRDRRLLVPVSRPRPVLADMG
jgi:hypothetical protein